MKIYNTLTKKTDDFIPKKENIVTMYTCGPTVYNYAHIGNLRCYIMEDILEKTLLYLDYNVKRVMNITDIGHLSGDIDTGVDKMVISAKKENKTVLSLAKYYTDCFFKDCEKLNIKKPSIVVPATSCVNNYIKFIEKLFKKGYAYFKEGNVYFDTSKLENYYCLSNHNGEENIIGARDGVDEDKSKKNKADFVLWFTKSKFDDQELKWDSPWGKGYPGWHIECSTISINNCGEYLDIHCGGVDNIFPHHTNEIAQSEAYLGHKWCNYFFHVEHLNTATGKMSKSKGETLTIETLENNGYNPIVYRYFCLLSHYRKQLVFSYEALNNAQSSYDKLKSRVLSLRKTDEKIDKENIKEYEEDFIDALSNDLNTSFAITTIHNVLKSLLNDNEKISLIKKFDEVLSINLFEREQTNIPEDIKKLIDKRTIAKHEKNFLLADQLREEISKKGYRIIDTANGSKIEKN